MRGGRGLMPAAQLAQRKKSGSKWCTGFANWATFVEEITSGAQVGLFCPGSRERSGDSVLSCVL
jgi:hypothetical protein